MRRNSMTLLGAALLASGIFYVVNSPDSFMTSILSLQEQQFIVEKGRDVAYKTTSGSFEIFVANTHTGDIKEFSWLIYLDREKVRVDITNTTGQGTINIEEQEGGALFVYVTDMNTINGSWEIIGIPFSGDKEQIFLGESQGLIDNKRKEFSVGNLSEFTSTHQ